MASIKNLKKDINNVLGDIIEGVYIVEATNGGGPSKEGTAIIDGAISTFDELIAKVNQADIENKKVHFNGIRTELETKANKLVDQLNSMAE
ncbi:MULTISPECIES: hypothetical protein [Maribacter]|uniref:Uncharacterized protein n=1 Tax=Maribacter flavus TaxID=1658664 RepID=A0A5B2TQ57_9FLAO|nr:MULTISPECIES: hypothetical protein [Maribacter]KAA2216404.1 hypothetical protein F0361_10355 [Maribacter flavus]MDC6406656.1 hypothetical protein [Maribacter sp. PR66]MEE1973902.1 hypothetical protein [Maribacter flavus]